MRESLNCNNSAITDLLGRCKLSFQPDVTTQFYRRAFTATTPWDSYLIRKGIWSYPPQAVLGPTFFAIPIEEGFFFLVQTYITATVYALVSKPIVHAIYLKRKSQRLINLRNGGLATFTAIFLASLYILQHGGRSMYLALILGWCLPFLVLLWSLASVHIISLPPLVVVLPIALPTFYLWIVDTLALRRGTWVIEAGTKLGWHLWPQLEIEEAIFFLVTNTMIVFGCIACDLAFAAFDAVPEQYGVLPATKFPGMKAMVRVLLQPYSDQSLAKLNAIKMSLTILEAKSKSFYAASLVFEGQLRLSLLALYGICRAADDMVDEATDQQEVEHNLQLLSRMFSPAVEESEKASAINDLPQMYQPVFSLLPSLHLPNSLFHELIQGFTTDTAFASGNCPIQTDEDLSVYADRVAGSVAEMCVRLSWQSYGCHLSAAEQAQTLEAAREMGRALQYVNIARDAPADLNIGRIYLPGRPLCKSTVSEVSVLSKDRYALLDKADKMAATSVNAIDKLHPEVQRGMKAACFVYLAVGRKVRLALDQKRVLDRARTSKFERLWTVVSS